MSKLRELVSDEVRAEIDELKARAAVIAGEEQRISSERVDLNACMAEFGQRMQDLVKRERATRTVSEQLTAARVAKVAAEDREKVLADKLAECRRELGEKTTLIENAKKCFPGLFAPAQKIPEFTLPGS